MGLSRYQFLNWLPDGIYLKIVYRLIFKKKLNLKNPTTYNEKLQWMKLYDRNPLYTTLADKVSVKEYVKKTIGNEYVVKTLGIYNHVKEIDYSKLPEQFVLKSNNDSCGIVICKDKKTFNKKEANKKLSKSLRQNGYWYGREWPYKNIKPKIIAEEYLEDSKSHELPDYKFFVFHGEVKAMFIATERFSRNETKFDFYDADFNHLDLVQGHPNSQKQISKPRNFEKMKELAVKIASPLPAARIDFYEVNGKTYFGEITFFHFSGLEPFIPETYDYVWGKWLDLPQ